MTRAKFVVLAAVLAYAVLQANAAYKIGLGRADCTGPITEINFMGYANPLQNGRGLHTRQFARTFIVEDNGKRVVFVSVDAAMMGTHLKFQVIKRLQAEYGDIYNYQNVILSGTHTHGAPGGFMVDILYDISIFGFVPQTFKAFEDGIVASIKDATSKLQEGRIVYAETTVLDANINRSPQSYLNNPATERLQYAHNVDKTLTQLRFYNASDKLIGSFNWFPVHPVSMNNSNHLVTSDNVGHASILLEKEYNPNEMPGKGDFVGAFASTNLGDVSPNIMGPVCEKTGRTCDLLSSRCEPGEGECFASGPGKDMFESTKIIAERIFAGANRLIKENKGTEITGEVAAVQKFINMTTYEEAVYNTFSRKVEKIRGCFPAMGYSFAAGTTDGQGLSVFKQGETTNNPLWDKLRNVISEPTEEDIKCHEPKPILLATGRAVYPIDWQPKTVNVQLLQIGNLLIAATPGEPTTMAGRRLKKHILATAAQNDNPNMKCIVAGLSNFYSSYITTPEEYVIQRYEGASTIYGPYTLPIYMEEFRKLTTAILRKMQIDQGQSPPPLPDNLPSLVPAVLFDGRPIGKQFGAVKTDANSLYHLNETVSVVFVAGNPRNNLRHEGTFLTVERKVNQVWEVVYTDASWETKLHWKRSSKLLSFSEANVEYTIASDTTPGEYRICHYGDYLDVMGGVFPYDGCSSTFTVRDY